MFLCIQLVVKITFAPRASRGANLLNTRIEGLHQGYATLGTVIDTS